MSKYSKEQSKKTKALIGKVPNSSEPRKGTGNKKGKAKPKK